VVDLSGRRQLALDSIVDQFGRRIVQDSRKNPIIVYPWRSMRDDADSTPVSINADVMSGSLVVSGTRIPVTTLLGLKLKEMPTPAIASR